MNEVHNHDHLYLGKFESDIQKRDAALNQVQAEYNKLELDLLSPDEIKVEVIFNSIKSCLEHGVDEIKDVARIAQKSLETIGQDSPVSDSYIKSMFNFDNVYVVLYDLLDLATNYTYQEKEKSTDYRDGIIDCIVALRRFQRFKGFGDYEWKPYFNSAVDISTDTREY